MCSQDCLLTPCTKRLVFCSQAMGRLRFYSILKQKQSILKKSVKPFYVFVSSMLFWRFLASVPSVTEATQTLVCFWTFPWTTYKGGFGSRRRAILNRRTENGAIRRAKPLSLLDFFCETRQKKETEKDIEQSGLREWIVWHTSHFQFILVERGFLLLPFFLLYKIYVRSLSSVWDALMFTTFD